jgi:MFS family permease
MPLALRLSPHHRVFAAFALYSFGMANIFPRLPAVQAQMGVAEGALGLGLIGTPVGTLLALTLAPPLIERVGHRAVLLVGLPLLSLIFLAAVHAMTPLALFVMLIPAGITMGCLEIVVNTEADRVEHQRGRRIMNRAHAFWSFGFFGAGVFGAALAGLGVSAQIHLAVVVPMVCVATWACLRDFTPAPHRPGAGADAAQMFSVPSRAILLLVVVTLSSMLMEGASIDWSAIYMRNVFETGPFLAGIAVASFAVSQALARYFADGLLERYSPAALARILLCLMLAGCVMVTWSPASAVSLAGFALMGIGASAIFPMAMSAAAQRPDRSAAVNIAALAQISFVIFLLGPPLLGYVAEHFGIRTSFGIGIPLIVLSLVTAGALGTRPIKTAV